MMRRRTDRQWARCAGNSATEWIWRCPKRVLLQRSLTYRAPESAEDRGSTMRQAESAPTTESIEGGRGNGVVSAAASLRDQMTMRRLRLAGGLAAAAARHAGSGCCAGFRTYRSRNRPNRRRSSACTPGRRCALPATGHQDLCIDQLQLCLELDGSVSGTDKRSMTELVALAKRGSVALLASFLLQVAPLRRSD
jgi:hypothetical protein